MNPNPCHLLMIGVAMTLAACEGLTPRLGSADKAKGITAPKPTATAQTVAMAMAGGGFRDIGYWKAAEPSQAAKGAGTWWRVFGQSDLNAMMEAAQTGNPSLQAVAARLDQAKQIAAQAKAARWPSFTGSGSVIRNKPASLRSDGGGFGGGAVITTIKSLSGAANWELDLWGRLRHTAAAAAADADAAQADLHGAELSLQAEVASAYFAWQSRVAEQKLLLEAMQSFQQSL
jgi:outer membrane protein TolC